jgi:hypothetical protein
MWDMGSAFSRLGSIETDDNRFLGTAEVVADAILVRWG